MFLSFDFISNRETSSKTHVHILKLRFCNCETDNKFPASLIFSTVLYLKDTKVKDLKRILQEKLRMTKKY